MNTALITIADRHTQAADLLADIEAVAAVVHCGCKGNQEKRIMALMERIITKSRSAKALIV